MINYNEAIKIILDNISPVTGEETSLLESAGRVLAEDVRASEDVPNFDRAATDGYAVHSKDTKRASEEAPVFLMVTGTVTVGNPTTVQLGIDQAIKVSTGVMIPEGVDAVINQDDVEEDEEGTIKIIKPVKPKENVSFRGEDIKKGEFIVETGRIVTPAVIGMLASIGKTKLKVKKKPVISIIATGNEVVDTDKDVASGEVRDSNSYSLFIAVNSTGGDAVKIGIIPDNPELIKSTINKIITSSDIILFSGGVSDGEHDYVKQVLEDIGATTLFWQVKTRPGKSVYFGKLEKKLIFGLPGFPVSSLISYELYVRPAILKILGVHEIFRKKVMAELETEISHRSGKIDFIRGLLRYSKGVYRILPVGKQKSNTLKSLVIANALIEIPEDEKKLEEGTHVAVWILD